MNTKNDELTVGEAAALKRTLVESIADRLGVPAAVNDGEHPRHDEVWGLAKGLIRGGWRLCRENEHQPKLATKLCVELRDMQTRLAAEPELKTAVSRLAHTLDQFCDTMAVNSSRLIDSLEAHSKAPDYVKEYSPLHTGNFGVVSPEHLVIKSCAIHDYANAIKSMQDGLFLIGATHWIVELVKKCQDMPLQIHLFGDKAVIGGPDVDFMEARQA